MKRDRAVQETVVELSGLPLRSICLRKNALARFVTATVCSAVYAENRCAQPIPEIGNPTGTYVSAMSANGMVIGGDHRQVSDPYPFVWSSGGFLFQSSTGMVNGLDRIGRVAVGFKNGGAAFVNLESGNSTWGMLPSLVPPPHSSNAFAVSDDGTRIVGWSGTGVLWKLTPQGWQIYDLGSQFPNRQSMPVDISGDGSVILVQTQPASGLLESQLWTEAEGVSLIPMPVGIGQTCPQAINTNGEVAVGHLIDHGNLWRHAFKWSVGSGTEDLGVPNGFKDSYARGVSDDGEIVVGYCQRSTSGNDGAIAATIWTAETGMVLLQDFLTDKGFDLSGWTSLETATAISADGAMVTGTGAYQGKTRAFIIRDIRPRACPSDLDGDGEVNAADLSLVLLEFGAATGCSPDLDGSEEVDAGDIGFLLLDFGSCP
jgi:uncharacterized membrane protein